MNNQTQPVKAEEIKNVEPVQESLEEYAELKAIEVLGDIESDWREDKKIWHLRNLDNYKKTFLTGASYQRSIEKDGWIAVEDVVKYINEIIKGLNEGINKDADKQKFGSEYTKGQNTAYRISTRLLTDLITKISPPKQL